MTKQDTAREMQKQHGDGDWGFGQRMNPEPSDAALIMNDYIVRRAAEMAWDNERATMNSLYAAERRAAQSKQDYLRLHAVEKDLAANLAMQIKTEEDLDKFWVQTDDIREVGYKVKPSDAASGSPVQSSGSDNDYWLLHIAQPKRKELTPYTVECEDIIEAFEMTFQEGEAFKALWRKCNARLGNGKPGDSPLRNAEKVAHFGKRMTAMEQRKL